MFIMTTNIYYFIVDIQIYELTYATLLPTSIFALGFQCVVQIYSYLVKWITREL